MSKFRTLTSGLSLGDALRLSGKQTAEELARQKEREAQQAEERRVLQAAKERVEAQRRMQQEMIDTRDAIAKRAQEAGGFEGIVVQPMYAGATGAVEGLGPPGDLATWTGEQALALAGALLGGGDAQENYRNIAGYREMAQKKHPGMALAGELVGSYAKQQIPPGLGLSLDVAAGATLEGIEKGFTPENLVNGAGRAFLEAGLGQVVANEPERIAQGRGYDLSSRRGKFVKDLLGVAADQAVKHGAKAIDGHVQRRAPVLSEETWRPAARYLSADPQMDPEVVRRIEAHVFVGGKPKGLVDFAPSRRGGT